MRQEIKDNIFDNCKSIKARKLKGYKVGPLKFKKLANTILLKNQTFKIIGSRLRIQGLRKKTFSLAGLDQLPDKYKIQSGKLVRNALGIYLHISVLESEKTEVPQAKKIIGVDLGIKDAFTFSEGTTINVDFSESEKQIRKAHKQFSRKKKDSRNRQKAKYQLNKKYQKLTNQKDDAAKKVLNKLKPYKVCFQDEMIKSWAKLFGRKVQKGILGRVKAGLKSNPDNVMIPRKEPTTQLCPECGALNKLKLSDRIYKCSCGYEKSRDVHAAQNMILFGMGHTDVELNTSVFNELSLIECKYLMLKQEANAL
jgi:putative transposase